MIYSQTVPEVGAEVEIANEEICEEEVEVSSNCLAPDDDDDMETANLETPSNLKEKYAPVYKG
jgi:hypothetical protein